MPAAGDAPAGRDAARAFRDWAGENSQLFLAWHLLPMTVGNRGVADRRGSRRVWPAIATQLPLVLLCRLFHRAARRGPEARMPLWARSSSASARPFPASADRHFSNAGALRTLPATVRRYFAGAHLAIASCTASGNSSDDGLQPCARRSPPGSSRRSPPSVQARAALLSQLRHSSPVPRAVLDVVGEDYIRTAHAKGLASNRVFRRHVLRAAISPVIASISTGFGILLGSAAIVDQVFPLAGSARHSWRRSRQET